MNPEFDKKQGGYSSERGENGRDGYKSHEGYNNYRGNGEQRSSYRSQRGGYNNRRPSYNNDDKNGEFRPNGFGAGLKGGDDFGGRRPYGQRSGFGRGDGSYNRRPNNYRPRFNNNEENNAEGGENSSYNSYGSRGGYNRQGGYNRNNSYNRQGGYNRNSGYNRQGGYNRNYNDNGEEGGNRSYGRRPYGQQGGFRHNPGFGRPRFDTGKVRIDYKETAVDPNEPIRLNKYLANAGICSRREADEFIAAGVVTVNGEVVSELGTKVSRSDVVKFHDQTVSLEKKVYVLLNKPKDTVTTSDDPQNRKTVMDLVKDACPERIYPVGRLDRNTTGVLLLTNDGEMASKLTHPKFLKKKVYHVYLDKNVTAHDMQQIADGVTLEDGEVHADAIEYAHDTDKSQVGIEIHSGKNRIVRRIFESLGYKVVRLDRVLFAGLTKKNLRRGDWRFLTEKEVDMLRMGAFE